MSFFSCRGLSCLLLWGVILAPTVRSQTFTGTIVGRVFDPQRAVVGNANVTLRSVERGVERRTTTESDGEYVLHLVPPGKFTVQAQAKGFAPTTVNVEVAVATPIRADVTLQVQPLQQSVQCLWRKRRRRSD
jgi:hypothetical protein